jgi:hypothetical protein
MLSEQQAIPVPDGDAAELVELDAATGPAGKAAVIAAIRAVAARRQRPKTRTMGSLA